MNWLSDERAEIAAILVGLVVSGIICFLVIVEAWSQQGLTWHLTYSVVNMVPQVGVGIIFVLPVGLFLGLASLVLLDDYKRAQGVFLWASIILGGIVLYSSGVFVTRVSWGNPINPLIMIVGALLGVWIGGLSSTEDLDKELREFPRALTLIYWISFFGISVFLVEALVAYQSPIVATPQGFGFRSFEFGGMGVNASMGVVYLLGSVGFIVTLGKFRSYENSRSVVVLGPHGSGKTTLLAGLEMTQRKKAERNGGLTTNANQMLGQLSDDIEFEGDFSRIQSTEGLQPFKFRFTKGNILRKISTIRALDHSGQDLTQFEIGGVGPATSAKEAYKLGCVRHDSEKGPDEPEALEMADEEYKSIVRNIREDNAEFEDYLPNEYADSGRATSGPDLTRNLISDMVHYSDVVVLLLPMEDFLDDEEIAERMGEEWLEGRTPRDKRDYIGKYTKIIKTYEDKNFVFASTMADLATDMFEDESHKFDMVDPNRKKNWKEFSSFVEEQVYDDVGRLGQHINNLDSSRLGQGDLIHPVYYNVEADEEGNEEINLDLRGSMDPMRGAEDVLEEVGR